MKNFEYIYPKDIASIPVILAENAVFRKGVQICPTGTIRTR